MCCICLDTYTLQEAVFENIFSVVITSIQALGQQGNKTPVKKYHIFTCYSLSGYVKIMYKGSTDLVQIKNISVSSRVN